MAKLAVCIGINDYPGTESDLLGCVNDANDWEAELLSRKFTVTKLLDKDATKSQILSSIAEVVKKAKSGDTVLFTYSGHGSWQPDEDGDEEDGRDEGWCPHDVKTNGLLLDDELFDLFGQSKVGVKLVMISDSCHSGSISKMAPNQLINKSFPRIRFMPPQQFLKKSQLLIADRIRRGGPVTRAKPDRALLLSGCQDRELSYDSSFGGRPNGAFTFCARQSLSKVKKDATYQDWMKQIRTLLPSNSYPQSPNLLGSLSQRNWLVLQ